MKYTISVMPVALSIVFICGCGGHKTGPVEPGMGTVSVKVTLPSGLSAPATTRSISEITKVVLTVSASDISTPIERTLVINPDTHSATDTFQVPAGANRLFTAEAKDSTNITIYSGSETAAIPAYVTTNIDIILTAVNGSVELVVIIHQGPAGLEFTYVPPIGSYENLTGKVTGGLNPEKLAVVIYIKVGYGWWTKPYWNNPKTLPLSDGTWTCDITTGGIDSTATEVHAYLVLRTFEPPLASGGSLPAIPDALVSINVVR